MKRWLWLGGGLGASLVFGTYLVSKLGRQDNLLGSFAYVLLLHAVLIVVSIILSIPFSDSIGNWFSGLLFPTTEFERPQPIYSFPEAQAIRGNFAGAMALYEGMVREYPEEVRPHLEMMELAWGPLKDGNRAGEIYEKARKIFRSKTQRAELEKFWQLLQTNQIPNRYPDQRGRLNP
jgi:hypothetical protein